MSSYLHHAVRTAIRRLLTPGHEGVPLPYHCAQMARAEPAIFRRVHGLAAIRRPHVSAICQSVAYLEHAGHAGAVVGCGPDVGGMLTAALALVGLDATLRQLYLFAGSAPNQGLHTMRAILHGTRYPCEKMIFNAGPLEDALPAEAPKRIALLLLEADSQRATGHVLQTLESRLAPGAILLVRDGQGSTAAEAFVAARGDSASSHVLDGGWLLVMPQGPTAIAA